MSILKCIPFFGIFSVFFFSILVPLNSQTINKIDSLLKIVEKQSEDTTKVKLLLKVSRQYSKTDPGVAMDYSNQAYSLASNLKFTSGLIDAMVEKSNNYTLTGQLDSALIFSQKAIHMSDSINDEKRMADSYSRQAGILIRKVGPLAASEYYFKAHNLYKKIGDSIGYMNSLNGLGIVYYRQAEYDSAIYYYIEFLRLCEKLKNEEGMGKGYVNLGTSYYELKDFKNARYYFNESIKVNEKFNNLRFLSIASNNLGSMAFDENNLDEAMYYYTLSQEQNNKINNVFGLAQAKNNIGNVYERRKEYAVALNYYSEAKDLFDKMNNIDGFIAAYKNVALIFERTKKYSKALQIYDSCLALARGSKLFKREEEILYNIHKTYELTGDFEQAYRIQTEYIAIKDSIFNQEKDKQIKQLEIKFQKEKDQALILALENENLEKNLDLRKKTNQRNGYLYSGIGLILIISFTFIFYRHKAVKDRIIADQKIRQLEEEKKLLAARFIVDGQEEERKRIAKELHDGLGVLLSTAKMQFSVIKDKSPENRSLIEKASKLLEQATGDVRKISHNMMPGLLTKFGLYEAVEDLFESLNDMEGLTANLKIEGETNRLTENKEEMANNTLRHAQASKMFLKIEILPHLLKIAFSDNGIGLDLEKTLKSKSMGLTSIQSRVKYLEGDLKIDSKPGNGVNYKMEIPY
jgi:signal transduction histidine kinase